LKSAVSSEPSLTSDPVRERFLTSVPVRDPFFMSALVSEPLRTLPPPIVTAAYDVPPRAAMSATVAVTFA
jgi:hypothetical protein